MKNKKILFTILFVFIILIISTTKCNASLYLNNLDIDAQINEDGSMDVTETWDINISETNTLYKTFKVDDSKYSTISNWSVSEIGGTKFQKSNSWAYHLTKGYYYGGKNNEGNFEICWGVGLDNSSATKTYKISYTVTDAIAKYSDVAELYWQFIGSDFEVSAKNITGKIKLPAKVTSKDDIKVWGHVDTLNGEIYSASQDTVEFNLNNYRSGRYVEIRVAFPTEIVSNSGRTYNKSILSNIIEEETKWANEANERREKLEKRRNIILSLIGIISIGIAFLIIKKIKKYIEVLKNTVKLVPEIEMDYYREKPDKESTPADGLFLYNKGTINETQFGNIFSSTLLNLTLKGYLKIEVQEKTLKKDEVIIYKTEKTIQDLQNEEKTIINFVFSAMKNEEKITIKDLQKYIKNHSIRIQKLIEDTLKTVEDKNEKLNKFNKEKSNKKESYLAIGIISIVFGVMLIIDFIIGIPLIILGIISIKIGSKLSRLTQTGIDEREKWKGLKKYMEDFSLLNEKEIPALTVWEEYLVYATVFGIADKVIKQLKIVYPEIENMDGFNNYSYVYLMSHTNFNSSFSSAINSSISSTMSSGSGGGGGFSGGGGGGRWPVAADGGR